MNNNYRERKLNFISHYSRLTFKRGMTLVEVLVSVVILSMMLGVTYTILNLQRVKSIQVQKTTVLQTDAQVALTLLKSDLTSAGLAYPKEDTAVVSLNDSGPGGEDAIRIKAVGLGFEASRIKWSWLLEAAGSNNIIVRGFSDSSFNFNIGDTVVCLDATRFVMHPDPLIVINVVPDTFDGPSGPMDAQRVTLSNPLNAVAGLVVIGKSETIYSPGLELEVRNNQLFREADVLLDNVEDLQFAYGIDSDGDEVIDTWTNDIPAFATLDGKWAIRYTLVVTSRPLGGYTYPHDSITVEDHTYVLNSDQKRRKRIFLSGIIAPPNLQP